MRRSSTSVSLNRILAVLLAAFFLFLGAVYGSYRRQAGRALREAKNVALSMKLLTIYGQAEGESVWAPDRVSGLSEQAEAEIRQLADVSGEIVLEAWDAEKGVPVSFTYAYGQCLVSYAASGDRTGAWRVDYRLPILRY